MIILPVHTSSHDSLCFKFTCEKLLSSSRKESTPVETNRVKFSSFLSYRFWLPLTISSYIILYIYYNTFFLFSIVQELSFPAVFIRKLQWHRSQFLSYSSSIVCSPISFILKNLQHYIIQAPSNRLYFSLRSAAT